MRRPLSSPTLCAGAVLALLLPIAGAAASPPPDLDLSRLRLPPAMAYELRAAGLARTALERPLGRAHGTDAAASAAVGFLCGRQPAAVTSGGAAAYGVDPHGRFLGAQLRFGFR